MVEKCGRLSITWLPNNPGLNNEMARILYSRHKISCLLLLLCTESNSRKPDLVPKIPRPSFLDPVFWVSGNPNLQSILISDRPILGCPDTDNNRYRSITGTGINTDPLPVPVSIPIHYQYRYQYRSITGTDINTDSRILRYTCGVRKLV